MRYLLPVLLIALLSCGTESKRLPNASGAQGEVLVVMDKGHWESTPGALVRSVLERPITTLPQREPLFKVVQCTPHNFGSLLRTHHTVLYAVIGNDTARTGPYMDQYARGQALMQVAATDGATWDRAFAKVAESTVQLFQRHQLERVAKRLAKERDDAVSEQVHSYHGVQLDIPGGFDVMKQENGSTWLQRDRMVSGSGLEHNVIEGVLIHHHPYVSDSIFNVLDLVNLRDSVTRAVVPGPAPGSYMVVQRSFDTMDLMPQGRAVKVDGRYGYLMEGLFGMEGAKMGGPFASLSTVCESQQRLITVEGFVYAPQFDKREYVRELEGVLFSMRLDPACIPLSAKE
jgi:hypothetical protein